MTTRRIERPRYGMVVSDGVAGRVFMLLSRAYPDPEDGRYAGDERLVWDALRINTPDGLSTVRAEPARVFLAPGEFAEVVEEGDSAAHEYEFVGGPADGRTYLTGGSRFWRVPVPPTFSSIFGDPSVAASPAIDVVDYELRRDGRYHLVGGS